MAAIFSRSLSRDRRFKKRRSSRRPSKRSTRASPLVCDDVDYNTIIIRHLQIQQRPAKAGGKLTEFPERGGEAAWASCGGARGCLTQPRGVTPRAHPPQTPA